MGFKAGRNINSNTSADVSTVTINSVTATTISLPNDDRISFRACLSPDLVDLNVIIRYYPAAQDNLKQGDVLTRATAGNNNLFRPVHKMDKDNVYYGEISAISVNGTHDIYITEY
jgi:hypothetical protein